MHLDAIMRQGRASWLTWTLALVLTTLFASGAAVTLAQGDLFPVGTVVRVANTDGQRLNLRAGPSTSDAVVGRLQPGATLTVTGQTRTAGGMRWLPVRTDTGVTGWVADQFVIVAAPPAATATRAPESTPTPQPPAVQSNANTNSSESEQRGGPLEVEAKLKYPELDGREQEITVWVIRNGEPVPGAIVTLETSDGDEDEHFRELDPTNEEGWTRRTFDVRRESGTVELRVQAVAPDGGEGQTIVSYFRR